jgi:uncharacterized protein (DUF302 family)
LRPVCLGGDHSITLPIVRAFGRHVPGLTIIHFDAHPDLYDELEGNRLSHACPFARIMEEGAAKRLIQVGIRTMTGHQREQAKKFGVEVIEMRYLPALDRMKVDGPIYISFDMDALDPAFAPGISHREPGGLSTREALAHLQAISGRIVGADIVEFNPAQDNTQLTATVAAKLLKEILGKMILNQTTVAQIGRRCPMASGMIDVSSRYSVPETLARLQSILKEKGITVFALVDHSGEAEKAGLKMRPTQLLIFGSPKGGTPLMVSAPSVAIDLPLKALAWQDEQGQVWLSYNSPEYLQQRHGFPADLLKNIAGIGALIQKAVE